MKFEIIKNKIIFSKDFLFVVVSVTLCFLLYLSLQFFLPLPPEKLNVEIEITKGMSSRNVLEMLDERGLVRDRNLVLILLKMTGADRKMKVGYYSFKENRSPSSILSKLIRGDVVQNSVTIIEGETVWNTADRLQEAGIMDKETFFRLNTDVQFRESLGIDAPSLEGYLYPDTYKFPKGFEPDDALRVMVNAMRAKFTDDMSDRMREMRFTEREVLTLASIIEKEAVIDFERPIISAVYNNRLKKRMRLEADPTAIYGIKDFSEGVTRYDLRRNTPYNTYRRRGLPPGPIAAPGLKSITAALYPADVPYLFFVSKNNGEHHFSATIREHFNAVRHYRSEKNRLRKANGNG